MPASDVGLWAQFGTELAKVIGNWQNSKDRDRLLYRIEAATNYVFVDEKTGDYQTIDAKRQKKLKLHFRKRIFDSS